MDSIRDSQATEQIAADWLAKRDGGSWTEADEAAFCAWQNESTTHRVAVIRLRSIWQHADRLQALGAGVPPGKIPPPGQWRTAHFGLRQPKAPNESELVSSSSIEREERVKVRWLPIQAAALLLTITTGLVWYSLAHGPNTYRTAVGESQALHLTDGSQVTLNTDSKIHVAVTESERRVELDRGEVFFEVAKDPSRPFVVGAGNKRVVAVGTKFAVLRTNNDLRVIVTEGKVRVEDLSHEMAEPSVQLAAGSIARAGDAGVLVIESSISSAEQALSWRFGYIVLRDTTLADAIAEFNRYNERQLVLDDPELAGVRIGGNLRLTNLEAFVRVLEQEFPIEVYSQDDRIVLRRR